eukprot:4779097-Prymnesium_polylepis.1
MAAAGAHGRGVGADQSVAEALVRASTTVAPSGIATKAATRRGARAALPRPCSARGRTFSDWRAGSPPPCSRWSCSARLRAAGRCVHPSPRSHRSVARRSRGARR